MKYVEMRILLVCNVPRFVKHIKDRGGVTDNEWQWLKCEDENPDCLVGVLARADKYLLYPKNEEIFKHGLFTLVKAIAIISFIPEGIHIFGFHFCSEIDNFVFEDT